MSKTVILACVDTLYFPSDTKIYENINFNNNFDKKFHLEKKNINCIRFVGNNFACNKIVVLNCKWDLIICTKNFIFQIDIVTVICFQLVENVVNAPGLMINCLAYLSDNCSDWLFFFDHFCYWFRKLRNAIVNIFNINLNSIIASFVWIRFVGDIEINNSATCGFIID